VTARKIDRCRVCDSAYLESVIDLGRQRLSEFRVDDSAPPAYPLELVRCVACGLAQLGHTVSRTELFHDTYSFKSGVSDGVRRDLHDVVAWTLARRDEHPAAWLDIASNDGTLLSYVPPDVARFGVDPLGQYAEEAREHATEIHVGYFDSRRFAPRAFDVVTSISMFYDVDDIREFVGGVERVLAADGAWVIQQNYLPSMLASTSVDNVSHEHLTYHSLGTLAQVLYDFGLVVSDISFSAVNGGCMRTLVTRGRRADPSVARTFQSENVAGIREAETHRRFAGRARSRLAELRSLVDRLVAEDKSIFVYGASTRGSVLWQAAGLDVRQLPKVVDRNPDKVGRWMSAIGAPIISEEEMRADPPDYLLVGPWWFEADFVRRERDFLDAGGRMIVPLPEVHVVASEVAEGAR